MAVIKVFDSKGVKTVVMLGNLSEQDYDPVEEELIEEEDPSVKEE